MSIGPVAPSSALPIDLTRFWYACVSCPKDAPAAVLEDEREVAYRDLLREMWMRALGQDRRDKEGRRALAEAHYTFTWEDWRVEYWEDDDGVLHETGYLRAMWRAVPKHRNG